MKTISLLRVVLLLVCLFVVQVTNAQQQASIKGQVADTIDFKTVAFATVSVIKYADSTLLKFVRVNEKGHFEITHLPPVKVRLLITRYGFVDYEDTYQLDSGLTKDVGVINLISKTHFLKEVMIRDKVDAIRIKGDTTEFLVDSFLTNKNASVEELMRKLPGIQVDKDGKITAQGKEVKKVLVDGEEFFGDDPTIATKNIKATQVESIQVFDKKSEQATISGIDDGEKLKTINLKLKEDAKKGYFGKVKGGFGTNNRYEHEGMINKFNRKQKVSAYAAMSNTNKTSLDWEDNQKYSGSSDMDFFMDDDGSSITTYSRNDGFYATGIPQTWYVGAHYSDKKLNDKHGYSFNFSYKEMTNKGYDNNYTKYILPDTFYFNNDKSNLNSFKKGTTLNGRYEWAVDSFTTLKFSAKVSQSAFTNLNEYNSENRNQLSNLINSNNRTTNTEGENNNYTSTLSLTRKFARVGRSLIAGVTQDYRSNNESTLLTSDLRLYTNDTTFTSTLIDQMKRNTGNQAKYSLNVTYTEPFGKKFFLITDYAFNSSTENSTRLTLVKSFGNDYIQLLDSLSSDFRYKVAAHRGGISLKYQFKKITTSLGGRTTYTDLTQQNLVLQTTTSRAFVNYFPAAKFGYKIGNSSSFEFNYNGNTRQPSLTQLQPLIDNSNPLRVVIGNNALVQSFTNTYELRYNKYKPLTGNGIWSNLSFTQTNNDFASKDNIATDGRRVYQTVNVNGNYRINGSLYHYFSLKKSGISFNNNIGGSHGISNNFINGLSNQNSNQSLRFGTNVSKEKEEKYYFSFNPSYSYNRSRSSLRSDVVTSYWIQTYELYAYYHLPKKVILDVDLEYNVRQQTADFQGNLNTAILNVGISRKFTKNENWIVDFRIRDLFNQNLGFYRTAQSNFINENVHSVLRRYFMINVTYNFTSAKTNETKK